VAASAWRRQPELRLAGLSLSQVRAAARRLRSGAMPAWAGAAHPPEILQQRNAVATGKMAPQEL